jgi:hypothetical protein
MSSPVRSLRKKLKITFNQGRHSSTDLSRATLPSGMDDILNRRLFGMSLALNMQYTDNKRWQRNNNKNDKIDFMYIIHDIQHRFIEKQICLFNAAAAAKPYKTSGR